MSADFWASYLSGAVGIIIGNPLDMIKVRLQASHPQPQIFTSINASDFPTTFTLSRYFKKASSLVTGSAAPALGYGALNAILFVTYNRTEEALNRSWYINTSSAHSPLYPSSSTGSNLWTTWLAGAAGGLATWVISTPTELIKCRAQLADRTSSSASSLNIARRIIRTEGIRGLYCGGVITALRDSIGYGFYFWAYELGGRLMRTKSEQGRSVPEDDNSMTELSSTSLSSQDAARVLLCGGVAGVVTWASIFPLDVVKTRVQAGKEGSGHLGLATAATPLLETSASRRRGAIEVAREAYQEGGIRIFFRGLTICSARAFIVNAFQWAVWQ
ncbi:mitochondrial carrier [Xylariaceae sp. FL1272]|nr:mitochondrial carrier [Xylariaceae sp. FL1272]